MHGKRETDTSYAHIRSRRSYRDRDANGGCSFPALEQQGYSFSERCIEDPEINASLQDCCMVSNLDLPLHNDFKTGREDRYYGKFIDRCRDYELGDISKVYLDGFLIAKHSGKNHFNNFFIFDLSMENTLICKFSYTTTKVVLNIFRV